MTPVPIATFAATPLARAADVQSALLPAGPQAAHIHWLWTLMLGVCAAVFVAVLAGLVFAVVRGRRRARDDNATPSPDIERADARSLRWVGAAVGASVLLLAVLFAASLHTDRALADLPLANALHIEVTGYQWWWDVRYDDPQPANVFTTANELHVPVGRPVLVTLKAGDVIHSLWVPNLAGKKDLVPGRTATLAFRADTPGAYRGQCAEFCGWQHALMALWVVAESPEAFEAWVQRQRTPAPAPTNALAQRGSEVFARTTCPMCHAVAGTSAQARTAPDLSHVASRRTLGAGTIPNTPAHRAAWVLDAQAIKPGVNMPPQPLAPADLAALTAYLDTLQ